MKELEKLMNLIAVVVFWHLLVEAAKIVNFLGSMVFERVLVSAEWWKRIQIRM